MEKNEEKVEVTSNEKKPPQNKKTKKLTDNQFTIIMTSLIAFISMAVASLASVLITKSVLERGKEQEVKTYDVEFEGNQCHIVGETKAKENSNYSCYITTDLTGYNVNISEVKMNGTAVEYTFGDDKLSIASPTNGNISISAYASDASTKYNVIFNGTNCHMEGNQYVDEGTQYSTQILTDLEGYSIVIDSVTMNNEKVEYSFKDGTLTVLTGATGTIRIVAHADDTAVVEAKPSYNLDETNKTCKVVGVDSENPDLVTDLVIPSTYVKEDTNTEYKVTLIDKGALKGLSNLKNLTIPFVGRDALETETQEGAHLFGYIFGDEVYEGVRSLTWQQTTRDNVEKYFSAAIPSSLEVVNVTGGSTINSGMFSGCKYLKEINFNSDYPTTELKEACFYNCNALEKVTFEKPITTFGKSAFEECYALEDIDLASATSIGDAAFYDCCAIKKIELPDSTQLTTVGSQAFSEMPSTVIFSKSNSKGENWASDWVDASTPVVFGAESTSAIQVGDYRFIPISNANDNIEYAYIVEYVGDYTASKITVPYQFESGGKTYITKYSGPRCFESYSFTYSIEFEKNGDNLNELTSIGAYAFYGCSNLKSINLSDTKISSLGDGAFMSCYNLSVDDSSGTTFLPSTITSIGKYCFYDCFHILTLDIRTVTSIGNYAFANTCYNYYNASGDLVYSETDASGNQAYLSKVILGYGLNKLGVGAFKNARGLSTISVQGEGSTTVFDNIPDYCFYHTKIGLNTGFTVTPTLETIGSYAFAYCTNLSKLDFTYATKVKSIDTGAFYGCTNISNDIVLPETLESIGESVFEECSSLKSLTINSTKINYIPYALCYNCYELESFSTSSTIKTIGAYAFSDCKNLSKINGNTSVEFTSDLVSIGDQAFANCYSISSMKLNANSETNTLTIGVDVFAGWTNSQTLNLNSNLIENYKAAKTVTTKFGWTLTNSGIIPGLSDKYTSTNSGSSKLVIKVNK